MHYCVRKEMIASVDAHLCCCCMHRCRDLCECECACLQAHAQEGTACNSLHCCMHTEVQPCTCMHTDAWKYMHGCVYVEVHVCRNKHTCMRTYACCKRMHGCTHVQTYACEGVCLQVHAPRCTCCNWICLNTDKCKCMQRDNHAANTGMPACTQSGHMHLQMHASAVD